MEPGGERVGVVVGEISGEGGKWSPGGDASGERGKGAEGEADAVEETEEQSM